MKDLEPRLPEIKVPTLVVQTLGDPVVSPEETALRFNSIGAKQKQYVPIDVKRHGILVGERAERVHALIAAFIEKR